MHHAHAFNKRGNELFVLLRRTSNVSWFNLSCVVFCCVVYCMRVAKRLSLAQAKTHPWTNRNGLSNLRQKR